MIASNCSREQGRATCWRTTDVSRAAACVNRGFSMRYLLHRRDTAVLAALPRFPPSYHRDVLRLAGGVRHCFARIITACGGAAVGPLWERRPGGSAAGG